MARQLGIEADAVVGKLIRVWSWASRNCPASGRTDVRALSAIDRVAFASGFAEAMRAAGWLVIEGDAVTFPNFDRHCSQTAKERALDQRRKRESRKNSSGDCPAKNRTETGPEKRREERDTTKSGISIVRPSIEEVAAYCRERGSRVDPQAWMDHYSANGWKVGRNPMKDWKAAVRQWERHDLARSKSAPQGKPVTFAQQRQQNVLDLIAKLEAEEAKGGPQLLEAAP